MKGTARHRIESLSEEYNLNMTPMIDVTFLLLVFFVLAGQFRTPEGRLDANFSGGGPSRTPPTIPQEDVRITIRDTGSLQPEVAVVWGEHRYAGTERLYEKHGVLQGLRSANPDLGVVIDPDENIPFRWVVTALNAATRAGYSRISLADRDRPSRQRET